MRWADVDLAAGSIQVERPLLLGSAGVYESTPKTRAGARTYWLDPDIDTDVNQAAGPEHRKAQRRARMPQLAGQRSGVLPRRWQPVAAGPRDPRFQALARQAWLPVIKLHEGRHTAVSNQRKAGVDPDLTQRTVGHATAGMTRHYTHPQAQAFRRRPRRLPRRWTGHDHGQVFHGCSTRPPRRGLPRWPGRGPGQCLRRWRRRTGIEPAGGAKRRPPVLKTGGATRHPDASAPRLPASGQRPPSPPDWRLHWPCGRSRCVPAHPVRARRRLRLQDPAG